MDELFAAKLSKLTGSKESIEGAPLPRCTAPSVALRTADLSQWVQFHRRRIKQIVPIWFKEVQKGACTGCCAVQTHSRQSDDGKRRMLYFYLCNDVMQARCRVRVRAARGDTMVQGSRKKGSECIEAFGKALPAATKLCSRCSGPREVLL